MSWNVALNKVIEIKNAYIERFGANTLYTHDCRTCLDHWVEKLGIEEYRNILGDLHKNEKDGLILLRYRLPHPIDGKDFYRAYDGLMTECRSVVIDLVKEELALVPFRKFRNLNECAETSEENIRRRLENAEVIEFSDKLDGSMQSARYYDGRLVVAGSRSLDREASFRLDNGYRFIESHENYLSMLKDHPHLTFIFEYIADDDPHVVDYSSKEKGLYLIGIRDVTDGREFHYCEVLSFADRYGVMTTVLSNTDIDGAMDVLATVDGKQKEGFVVNIDGFRIKMKSEDYVALNTAIWGLLDDHVLFNAVKADILDDVLPKINEPMKSEVIEKADRIISFMKERESITMGYFDRLRKQGFVEKKNAMIWISENVPEEYSSFVRAMYLGNDVDYLKNVRVEDILGTE